MALVIMLMLNIMNKKDKAFKALSFLLEGDFISRVFLNNMRFIHYYEL